MPAIMSENGRKMTKIMHNAAKEFDWACGEILVSIEIVIPFDFRRNSPDRLFRRVFIKYSNSVTLLDIWLGSDFGRKISAIFIVTM